MSQESARPLRDFPVGNQVPGDGIPPSPEALCPPETHAAAKQSLAAFAVACGGRLYVWPPHTAEPPATLSIGGLCGGCSTDLATKVPAAEWRAFYAIAEAA